MTEAEIRQVFRRFQSAGLKFDWDEGKVFEWTRAFRYVNPNLFARAADKYILTSKWAPKISEIHTLICSISGGPKSSVQNNRSTELWKYLLHQYAKGLVYVREPHPKGYRTWFCHVNEARMVGEWRYGSHTIPRYVWKNTELPEHKIGEGETWLF